jgi:hypothetical protein
MISTFSSSASLLAHTRTRPSATIFSA